MSEIGPLADPAVSDPVAANAVGAVTSILTGDAPRGLELEGADWLTEDEWGSFTRGHVEVDKDIDAAMQNDSIFKRFVQGVQKTSHRFKELVRTLFASCEDCSCPFPSNTYSIEPSPVASQIDADFDGTEVGWATLNGAQAKVLIVLQSAS